ncbi:unnamed protein product [Allacma fusca]|uniref:K Homology domain-containing protein n=1 Tax=Allacma fusca TaxID=39272 RepID=A0A8J2PPT4_9HEXA|nr:unnamed protein product [Allacma fusca]
MTSLQKTGIKRNVNHNQPDVERNNYIHNSWMLDVAGRGYVAYVRISLQHYFHYCWRYFREDICGGSVLKIVDLAVMDRRNGGKDGNYEDPRIWQLALELYQLGLNSDLESESLAVTPSEPETFTFDESINLDSLTIAARKKQCVTEYVPVPTSEHVAEIIGRQGCKIKQLRIRSNAYIKTPERGDEPVFVVTGRKEDVELAKQEIRSAADHFSRIRALRKRQSLPFPPPSVSGLVTVEMRVPYCVVGLVVGPKGSTIKHIQQLTNTYIVTPSRDSDPIFEVTGMPDNVDLAQREIQAHIAFRTGQVGNPNYGLPNFEPELYGGITGTNSEDYSSSFWSEEGCLGIVGKGGKSMSSSLSSLSYQAFGGSALPDSVIGVFKPEMSTNQSEDSGSFSAYNLFQAEPFMASRSSSSTESGLETSLRFS